MDAAKKAEIERKRKHATELLGQYILEGRKILIKFSRPIKGKGNTHYYNVSVINQNELIYLDHLVSEACEYRYHDVYGVGVSCLGMCGALEIFNSVNRVLGLKNDQRNLVRY